MLLYPWAVLNTFITVKHLLIPQDGRGRVSGWHHTRLAVFLLACIPFLGAPYPLKCQTLTLDFDTALDPQGCIKREMSDWHRHPPRGEQSFSHGNTTRLYQWHPCGREELIYPLVDCIHILNLHVSPPAPGPGERWQQLEHFLSFLPTSQKWPLCSTFI